MTAYVARITASDTEILDDLRTLAGAIERGDITTAPGEGRSPLTRALMYVEDTTGWDAWTCSYVGGESDDEVVSDIESATRYPNWRDAMEAGMYRREFGETVDVLPVDE